MPDIDQVVQQHVAEGHKLKLAPGYVSKAPASYADTVKVTVPAFSHNYDVECAWQPNGFAMPAVNDMCMVAFDESGFGWVTTWRYSNPGGKHLYIPTEETRDFAVAGASYGKLPTSDELTITIPAGKTIEVAFQAMWKNSVASDARAAIFIGADQLRVMDMPSPVPQEAQTAQTNYQVLASTWYGLASSSSSSGPYTGDVTTGQSIGEKRTSGDGGACELFAPAHEGSPVAISIQFKVASGTVTVKERRLWVRIKE